MSRQPADLTGGIAPREIVWETLRQLRECDLGTLSRQSGQPQSLCKEYLRSLRLAGIVEAVRATTGPLGRSRNMLRLVRDMGICAPRVRRDGTLLPATGRQRMWRAMGILKEFSLRDLVATASLPEAPISLAEAEYYCKWLVRGHYLRAADGRYCIVPVRRHGPRAPMIQRVRRLLDPNTGEIVCESHAVEEQSR